MVDDPVRRISTFDNYVAPLGGRYIPIPEEKANAQAAFVEMLRTKVIGAFVQKARRSGKPIILEIGYVDDASFNAFAAHHDGVDIIALHRGNINRLTTTMFFMMDRSEAFADVCGDEPRLGVTMSASALRYDDLDGMLPFIGSDQRLRLSFDLASLAENFIIFHELAHILNGHIDWIGERGGLRMLGERGDAAERGLTTLDYQTLEYDADASAINILVGGAVRGALKKTARDVAIVPTTYDPAISIEIRQLAFALYTVFKLFESAPCASVAEVLQVEHPPARVRAQFALVGINTVLQRHFSIPTKVYNIEIARSFIEAELAWNTLTGEPLDHIFTAPDKDLGTALMELYNERWRDIHPDLDRLKLSKSVAKAWDDQL